MPPAGLAPDLEKSLPTLGLLSQAAVSSGSLFQRSSVYPSIAAKALGKPGPVALISNQTGR